MSDTQKLFLCPNESGFLRADFKDGNGDDCSIQESSAVEAPFLWLGCNKGTHHMGDCMARMHLTQDNAKQLIPLLGRFVELGHLGIEEEDGCRFHKRCPLWDKSSSGVECCGNDIIEDDWERCPKPKKRKGLTKSKKGKTNERE